MVGMLAHEMNSWQIEVLVAVGAGLLVYEVYCSRLHLNNLLLKCLNIGHVLLQLLI